MGAGMDKVLPGLFVGSLKDSKDREQLEKNQITHILSIHDDAKEGLEKSITYLCIRASDCANQDLLQYFTQCIEFIHKARLDGGNVLVHCLAGVSRSTTIVIAYVMTVTELSWVDAMNSVRGARKVTNPNFGFQRQLQTYEHTRLKTEKNNLLKTFGDLNKDEDASYLKKLLEIYTERQQLHINAKLEKNYPLPYNAYNIDDKMQKKFIKNLEFYENLDSNKNEKKTFKELEESFSNLEIEKHEKKESKKDDDKKLSKFFGYN